VRSLFAHLPTLMTRQKVIQNKRNVNFSEAVVVELLSSMRVGFASWAPSSGFPWYPQAELGGGASGGRGSVWQRLPAPAVSNAKKEDYP
jgi:hypothetical protein